MRRFLLALLLSLSPFAFADPQTGLWWSPAESGRGYGIDVQGETVVVTSFAYDASGNMQWYYSDGKLQNGGTRFSGYLLKFNRGQPLNGPYTGSPSNIGNDGYITIDFSSHTKGMLTLPGGRRVAIERQNFGVGSPPQSLLGDWIYVYSIGSRTSTYSERYVYSSIGSATSTGNGVVVDTLNWGGAEYQTTGSMAGMVFAAHFTSSGTVLDIYVFDPQLEEGRGYWLSPTTGNQYGLNAYRIGSPGGTHKALAGNPPTSGMDLLLKAGSSGALARNGISLAEVSALNPELGAVAGEMWNALVTENARKAAAPPAEGAN